MKKKTPNKKTVKAMKEKSIKINLKKEKKKFEVIERKLELKFVFEEDGITCNASDLKNLAKGLSLSQVHVLTKAIEQAAERLKLLGMVNFLSEGKND